MASITVRIKGGVAKIHSEGFSGEACLRATAALEKALGQKTSDTPTEEMSEPEVENHLKAGA